MQYRLVRSLRRRNVAFSLDPDTGMLLVHVPQCLSERVIARMVETNSERIERLRDRKLSRERQKRQYRFVPGGEFPLLGQNYPLVFSARLLRFENAFLVPRGEEGEVKENLSRLYAALAAEIMERKTRETAERFGLSFRQLKITGARTRWGSCSARGTISYSWRLLLWPENSVNYVVCHELAHRREMNHSSRFWAVVESMYPNAREQRSYFREHFMEYETW